MSLNFKEIHKQKGIFALLKKFQYEFLPILESIDKTAKEIALIEKHAHIKEKNIIEIENILRDIKFFFSNRNQWDEVFKKEGIYLYPEILSEVADLADELPENSTILDLGCGSGRHVIHLARNNIRVYGIDSSSAALEECKKWLQNEHLTAELKKGDIFNRLPFPKNFFDAVISIKSMHHNTLPKIKNLMLEIEKILKPKGYFLIETPATHERKEKAIFLEKNTIAPIEGREKGLPHYIFTENSLKKLCRNFTIEDCTIKQSTSKRQHFILKGRLNKNE